MPISHPEELILQYLAGELDAESSEVVRAYLVENPGRRGVVAGVRTAVRGTDIGVMPEDLATSRRELLAKVRAMGEPAVLAVGEIQGGDQVPAWSRRLAMQTKIFAATVAMIVLAGIVWIAGGRLHGEASVNASRTYTYTTAMGQRTTVLLGNGTSALLAPGTRLTYRETADSRQVTLNGSAYFTVAHKDGMPFSVRTSQAVTRVLGTEFTVRAYADELDEMVLVKSGRVAVRATDHLASQAVVLSSGQRARVDVAQITAVTSAIPTDFAWVRGALRFTDVRVGEAFREIGRWYDLDIRVVDPALAAMHLNASFTDESRQQVIEYLSIVLNASVEWDGRVVTFRSREPVQHSK